MNYRFRIYHEMNLQTYKFLREPNEFLKMFPIFLSPRYERVSASPHIRFIVNDRHIHNTGTCATLEVYSPRPSLIHCELTNLSSNGDLNLNTSLDVDDDLLDGLGGGEKAR